MLDGHIHLPAPGTDTPDMIREKLLTGLKAAGLDGGAVISAEPGRPNAAGLPVSWGNRLSELMAVCDGEKNLYPLFWINPTEPDAAEQAEAAAAGGAAGFKVICSGHEPGDSRAMPVYRRISSLGKPILFHSGILWDGRPSAPYNRPGMFECLLEVEGLRFTLAHVSWPWCDECIAVFGKFLNSCAHQPSLTTEMFIDLTPGTPPLWRKEVLTKLFGAGYDVARNVIFGSDCLAHRYNVDWTRDWMTRDNGIYAELGLDTGEGFLPAIYGGNLLRFLGVNRDGINRVIPRMADS